MSASLLAKLLMFTPQFKMFNLMVHSLEVENITKEVLEYKDLDILYYITDIISIYQSESEGLLWLLIKLAKEKRNLTNFFR